MVDLEAHAAPPPPVYFEPPAPAKQLAAPRPGPARAHANTAVAPEPAKESQRSQQPGASIEDIIAAADRDAREQTPPRNGAAKPESKTLAKPIQRRSVPPEPVLEEPEEDEQPEEKPAAKPG